MDLNFTPEEQHFREQVATWLRENVPHEPRPYEGDEARSFELGWQRKLHEAGRAGIAWPSEYGGRGLSTIQQLIWHEEYAKADAPYVGMSFVGVNHAGPTLIAEARDEHKAFLWPTWSARSTTVGASRCRPCRSSAARRSWPSRSSCRAAWTS